MVWVGGGSLGLLFASKFALAGLSTELIVRSEAQRQSIELEGLRLVEDHRQLTASSACSTLSMPWTGEPPDWIALMVKQSHLTEELILRLAELMDRFPLAKLLCFQNGIGHEERLESYIARERIFTAVTTEAAYRTGLNTVEHTGRGMVWFGHLMEPDRLSDIEGENLTSQFTKAGFVASMSKNIKERVWKKLLINAVINPLTALLHIRNGELLASSDRQVMMRELFEETKTVANAEGGGIREQLWDELINVCERTSDNYSSMLQDVSSGRETEVDWINGSIVRLGERKGLQTPLNRMVTLLIKEYSRNLRFSDSR